MDDSDDYSAKPTNESKSEENDPEPKLPNHSGD